MAIKNEHLAGNKTIYVTESLRRVNDDKKPVLAGKPEGLRLPGRRRRRWKDNVEKCDRRVWTGFISLD
jgi:hypothetical protein